MVNYILHYIYMVNVIWLNRYVSVQIIKDEAHNEEGCTTAYNSILQLCEVEVFGSSTVDVIYVTSSRLRCMAECANNCLGIYYETLPDAMGNVMCHQINYETNEKEQKEVEGILSYTYSYAMFNNKMIYCKGLTCG